MGKRQHYSWRQFDSDIKKIAGLIKKSKKKFDGVWGPPRGGLVPAIVLSHALGIPLLLQPTKDTLIVDDVADTGKTLASYQRNFIVTIFYHRQSFVVPNIWLCEKKDIWIVFPWEVGS